MTAVANPVKSKTLDIASSPHIMSGRSVDVIMRNVVWALLPVAAFGVFAFGLAALATLVVAVLSCIVTEHVLCRVSGRATTVADASAVITGLLYGLTLPPGLPLWMNAVGAVFGIGVAKALFGGLGYNAFNPALVGRAFAQAAFPAAMTTWHPSFLADRFSHLLSSNLALPFSRPVYDGLSGATPLSAFKFEQKVEATGDLAFGFISGSTGETCAVLILLGGVYLVARRMMSWRVPVAVLLTVAVLSAVLHFISPSYPAPAFMLFSGGLMLGAVFMATDMVATPMTHAGLWLYGALIGLLVVVIRVWGGMPEGVMYAILFANATSPLIDRWIQPRVYGTGRKGSARTLKGQTS
jgi:electron transport complex protein RnfD